MKKTNHLSPWLLSLAVFFFAACEEDSEVTPTGPTDDSVVVAAAVVIPPVLSNESSEIATVVKFRATVDASQMRDTVYYVLLTADAEKPTSQEILERQDVTELPMEGQVGRVTFRSDLNTDTDYMVYAVVKENDQVSEVSSLSVSTRAMASSDTPDMPGVSATLKAPVVERRGVPQSDLISLAVMVGDDLKDGTIHYLYFKEKDHEGAPTPQALIDHRLQTEIALGGATLKKFNFGASSQTKYFIYVLIELNGELSEVALLEAETV